LSRTVWAPPARVDWPQEIREGNWFVVAIHGGGIARCRVTIPHESWHARLDYEFDPDADAFGGGPQLQIEESATAAVVHVASVSHGATVERVLARDPRR